jgi:hypothetical protein
LVDGGDRDGVRGGVADVLVALGVVVGGLVDEPLRERLGGSEEKWICSKSEIAWLNLPRL